MGTKRRAFVLGAAALGIGKTPSGINPVIWTPLRLGASLLAWWSADRADKLTLAGNAVSSWLDLVASYDAAQATGSAQPTKAEGSFGVAFDGIGQYLTLASVPFPSGAVASEIWATVDQAALVADTAVRQVASYGSDSINTQRRLRRIVVSAANRVSMQTGTGATAVVANAAASDFSGRRVARAEFRATEIAVSLGGTELASAAAVSATGTTRFRIGATASNTPANFWHGQIRDLIVTSALSASDAARLNSYLSARLG